MKSGLLKTATLMLLLVPALAQKLVPAPLPPPPDNDPFVGTWHANREQSRPKLTDREAAYTRMIARDGEYRVLSSRMESPRLEAAITHSFRIRCDGRFHPVQAGALTCSYKCSYKTSNLVEGESITPAAAEDDYWAEEVSVDSQKMTISAYRDRDRQKLKGIQVLDRVKKESDAD